MKTIENDKTSGTVILTDDEGKVVDVKAVPAVILSYEEAQLLKAYKQFLSKYGIREALYCQTCFAGDRNDGMQAIVTSGEIVMRCRCKQLFWRSF